MRLEGKVAVITGAGSGMGREMAILFASEGAKVVGCDWNAETMDEVVATVSAAGNQITGMRADVSDQASIESVIDKAVSTYGRLDILCNNAGVNDLFQGVAELPNDVWQRTLGVNLNGPMFASRYAIPIMIKQGNGSIVNTASKAAISGAACGAAYTISKHGVVGLTRSTAWMYAQKGIRCNAICPGGVETNIIQSVDSSKIDQEGYNRVMPYVSCMPALLKPIEIARLALFLASDESKYINGAIIPADAGWTAT